MRFPAATVSDIHNQAPTVTPAKNANLYGIITQSSEDGEIYTNTPPYPYGGNLGSPLVFELDLKRKDSSLIQVRRRY